MKKKSQDTVLFDKDFTTNKFSTTDKDKTTNVNILLNRVRLDRKRDLKKKLIFFSILTFTISTITIFALV